MRVPFFPFTCKMLSPMDSSRLSTKVIFQIPDPCGDEKRVNLCTNSRSRFRIPCIGYGFMTTS